MPAQSPKRIQVGFSEVTLKAVEDLAEFESLKLSRVCSILIEEALIARGLLQETKMGERMPSSLNPIVPDDAITPPDPEPLTPVNELLSPLTDDEKTKVIKETGGEPFTVNKPDSMGDRLAAMIKENGWSAQTVSLKRKKEVPLSQEEWQLADNARSSGTDLSKLPRRDLVAKLIELKQQQMDERKEIIDFMSEMLPQVEEIEDKQKVSVT